MHIDHDFSWFFVVVGFVVVYPQVERLGRIYTRMNDSEIDTLFVLLLRTGWMMGFIPPHDKFRHVTNFEVRSHFWPQNLNPLLLEEYCRSDFESDTLLSSLSTPPNDGRQSSPRRRLQRWRIATPMADCCCVSDPYRAAL